MALMVETMASMLLVACSRSGNVSFDPALSLSGGAEAPEVEVTRSLRDEEWYSESRDSSSGDSSSGHSSSGDSASGDSSSGDSADGGANDGGSMHHHHGMHHAH